jgi:hypothetical protein
VALEHLFDAELVYQAGIEPIANDGEGKLVGSGDGIVDGPRIRGSLRWTLFEGPGELTCPMNPILAIETEDGTRVGFEGRGYARRASPQDQIWRVAATLIFQADAERFAWLDGALAVWEGEFDNAQGRAHYRAFLQTEER